MVNEAPNGYRAKALVITIRIHLYKYNNKPYI